MNFNELLNAIYKLYYDYDNPANYQIINKCNDHSVIMFRDLKSDVFATIPDPVYGDHGYGAVYNQILRGLKLSRLNDFMNAQYL